MIRLNAKHMMCIPTQIHKLDTSQWLTPLYAIQLGGKPPMIFAMTVKSGLIFA